MPGPAASPWPRAGGKPTGNELKCCGALPGAA